MRITENVKKYIIRNISDSPSGMSCSFIPVDDEWAIKLFFDENKRDYAFEKQSKLAKHDLAPKVGTKVDIPNIEKQYGYVTEIITPIIPFDELEDFYDNDNSYYQWEEYLEQEYGGELAELLNRIYNLGFTYQDNHCGNFGLKDGKLLPLDFDNC